MRFSYMCGWLLVSFFLILNAVLYKFSLFEFAITSANLILSILYFKRKGTVLQNLASSFLLIYLLCSFTIYAAFKIGGDEKYSYSDYTQLAVLSNHLLFIYFIGTAVTMLIYKRVINNDAEEVIIKPFSTRSVYTIIFIGFILSIICFFLGIGRMGAEGVVLPFKLAGIMEILRIQIYPVLLLIIAFCNSKDKKLKKYLILFFIWGILECFVRLSKSSLLSTFLPTIVLSIYTMGKIKFAMVKNIFPILLVFFLLYPIIEVMRGVSSDSLLEAFFESKEYVSHNESNEQFWIKPYDRVFMSGSYYMNALPYIKTTSLFDFSRLPMILYLGGSPSYTTYVIDGFSFDVNHSSGTTGILDALLIGGYGLCYIIICLLIIFAFYIDKISKPWKLPLKSYLFVYYIGTVQSSTLSQFIGPLILPYFSSMVISIFLIHYICKSRILLKTN